MKTRFLFMLCTLFLYQRTRKHTHPQSSILPTFRFSASCFNSLQTGNCIQTQNPRPEAHQSLLPFQFPSNRKLHSNSRYGSDKLLQGQCFNSLQTGNCIQTINRNVMLLVATVSIPFKRETAFKPPERTPKWFRLHRRFQFPSNGKLHSNEGGFEVTNKPVKVSIPFKRETAFKLAEGLSNTEARELCFNSLQTGNCIQTRKDFKMLKAVLVSFNSLQTGNCIQTFRIHWQRKFLP